MEYLKIWVDFREVMEDLTDEEKGRLFDAMLGYAADEEQPMLIGNERFIWAYARQTIDRTRAHSETMKENGLKGGRPKKQEEAKETKAKQSEPKQAVKRFVPPTVDEVRTYCKERGNQIDAEHFVDFYTSKGWRIGTQPMKDWKAAVRTWEQRNKGTSGNAPAKVVVAQQYDQRSYAGQEESGDDLMAKLQKRRESRA